MPDLTSEQKLWIVTELAKFKSPRLILGAAKLYWPRGPRVTDDDIAALNPDGPILKDDFLRGIYAQTRETLLANVSASVPLLRAELRALEWQMIHDEAKLRSDLQGQCAALVGLRAEAENVIGSSMTGRTDAPNFGVVDSATVP